VLLDRRNCDCCQVAATRTARGPVVAYRDRTEDEVRDIAVVRRVNGAWTEPAIVHDDHWQIAACPVNGPALASRGDTVVIAWFTAGHRIRLACAGLQHRCGSDLRGAAAYRRQEPGRAVDVEMLDDGSAAVSWLERTDSTTAGYATVRCAATRRLVTRSSWRDRRACAQWLPDHPPRRRHHRRVDRSRRQRARQACPLSSGVAPVNLPRVAFALAVLASTACTAPMPRHEVAVGKPIPPYAAKTLDGRVLDRRAARKGRPPERVGHVVRPVARRFPTCSRSTTGMREMASRSSA
jgi:hypothetical protein